MPQIAVHNSTSAPVLVDDGRVIGAGEFGVANPDDPAVKQLLDTESLREITGDPSADDVDPDAAAALRAASSKTASKSNKGA